MEKTFIKIRNQIVNLRAVSYVEINEEGGVAITVQNRDKPFHLNRPEAQSFLKVLTRFSITVRE